MIGRLNRTGPIAQWSEQGTHNPLVLGSSPSGPTNKINELHTIRLQSKNYLARHLLILVRITFIYASAQQEKSQIFPYT